MLWLSRRELYVLTRLVQGCKVMAIAHDLGVSCSEAHKLIDRMCERNGISGQHKIVKLAVRYVSDDEVAVVWDA